MIPPTYPDAVPYGPRDLFATVCWLVVAMIFAFFIGMAFGVYGGQATCAKPASDSLKAPTVVPRRPAPKVLT